MKERIKELAREVHHRVLDIRRHLHMHPELSFEEYETSRYIQSILDEWGVSYESGLAGGTGIIAMLGSGDPVIALRADIDALPIQEASEAPYRSKHEGKMHACGHDVHSSSLLGTLWILKQLENELPGRIKFLFQPGEERLPGGASMMIADGALEGPDVEHIFGQHVHPSMKVGKVGVRPESFMASCDEIFIDVIGQGGHGAMPQDVIDPVYISAEIITALQTVISRNCHPGIASVLSIGKINSDGGATNVIPDKVMMEGTFRTFDEGWRAKAHQLIIDRATAIGQAHGATVDVRIDKGYPALYNNPKLTNLAMSDMQDYMGADNVILLPARMTAEDFSYYSQQVPACFYRLGTQSMDGSNASPVHTNTFDIDPEALLHSTGLMAYLAVTSLRHIS